MSTENEDARADLVEAVQTHTGDITKAEKRLAQLVSARAAAFKALNLTHGMSYREIGKIAGLAATAVMRALRHAGVEVGESQTKPGPKASSSADTPAPE